MFPSIAIWCAGVAAFAAGTLRALTDSLYVGPLRKVQNDDAATDRLQDCADEILDEFRVEGPKLAEAARRVFTLLGELPEVVNWNSGLRRALSALVEAAVQESERFGSGSGPKKRAFAIDLVIRVLRRYNLSGLPFIPPIEDVFVKPVIGVLIDWSVEVLKIHGAWAPIKSVRFPSLYQGAEGKLLRVGVWVWTNLLMLKRVLVYPSAYERNLRDALQSISPEIDSLVSLLPPPRMQRVYQELANIIVELGQVTAPHVRLVDEILRFGREAGDLTQAELREVVFRVLRDLVREAYSNDALALAFLDSSFGDSLLRALVNQTEWILERNGILPREVG